MDSTWAKIEWEIHAVQRLGVVHTELGLKTKLEVMSSTRAWGCV